MEWGARPGLVELSQAQALVELSAKEENNLSALCLAIILIKTSPWRPQQRPSQEEVKMRLGS
jgi:hypothetical protein